MSFGYYSSMNFDLYGGSYAPAYSYYAASYLPELSYAPSYGYMPSSWNFNSYKGLTTYSYAPSSSGTYAPSLKSSTVYRSDSGSSRRTITDVGDVKGDKMFDEALNFVLGWEGGFSNDPADSGGRTNKGITQNTYNAWLKKNGLPKKDVKNITNEEVRQIYYNEYWKPLGCSNLPEKVALFIFDTGVNMGVSRGKEYLRRYNNGESLESLIDAREGKYRDIAANSPAKRKFLNGWLNRLGDLESTIALA